MQKIVELRQKIAQAVSSSEKNVYYSYSPLWLALLAEREADASMESFLDSSQSSGTSGVGRIGEKLLPSFIDYIDSIALPPGMTERFPISSVGSGIREYKGRKFSESHSQNLIYLERILAYTGDFFQVPRRVIEIGAGYGGVGYFLLKAKLASTYTVIDLPENLVNSAYYLSENFPELRIAIAGVDEIGNADIILAVPGKIAVLEKQEFDLAINTDSLGEMPVATTRAYVDWVYAHLKPHGLFFSKNCHRKHLGGAKTFTEYGFEKFALRKIAPTQFRPGVFDDFSHLVLMQKAEVEPKPLPGHLNAYTDLVRMGLHEEIIPLGERLASGALTTTDIRFLEAAENFYSRRMVMPVLEGYEACALYINGMAAAIEGRETDTLASYVAVAQSPVAKCYAKFLSDPAGFKSLNKDTSTSPADIFHSAQLFGYLDGSAVHRILATSICKDYLRKKVLSPAFYKQSPVVSVKNAIFNFREGKGISIFR